MNCIEGKKRSWIWILLVVSIAVPALALAGETAPSLSRKSTRAPRPLLGFLEKEPNDSEFAYLLKCAESDNCITRSIAVAVLFESGPEEYWDLLLSTFSVNDYLDRSNGEYNMVSSEYVAHVIREIENSNSSMGDIRRVFAASFCIFRERNEWFETNDGRISAARFFRGAFLSTVLTSPQFDAVEISNRIDRHTEESVLGD